MTATGVILSLIFVALEIRANTEAVVEGATIQGIAEQGVGALMDAAAIPEVRSGLWKSSAGDLNQLTPDEEVALTLLYSAALRVAENRFRQANLALVDDAAILGGAGASCAHPFFGAFWASRRPLYPSDFAAYVDATIVPLVRDSIPWIVPRLPWAERARIGSDEDGLDDTQAHVLSNDSRFCSAARPIVLARSVYH